MKVIIQIPCLNEADTLPVVLRELPRSFPGVDQVEWLVVDDGSTDATADVARAHGVEHIVKLSHHQGLARAFMAGLEECVSAGADIIVNTDADRQYESQDIALLVNPIVAGSADLVIGARPIATMKHFSPLKRLLQRAGSAATSFASGTPVRDAASGFRAMTREVATRLHVYNEYTYTAETVIQAGRQGMRVLSVPIRVNPDLRPSRLVRGTGSYVRRQLLTIIRAFVIYKPFRFFAIAGAMLFLGGFVLGLRFLAYYILGEGGGYVQSLILAALLMGVGFFLAVTGLIADLIAVNRLLLEGLDERLKRAQLAAQPAPLDESAMPFNGEGTSKGSSHGVDRVDVGETNQF